MILLLLLTNPRKNDFDNQYNQGQNHPIDQQKQNWGHVIKAHFFDQCIRQTRDFRFPKQFVHLRPDSQLHCPHVPARERLYIKIIHPFLPSHISLDLEEFPQWRIFRRCYVNRSLDQRDLVVIAELEQVISPHHLIQGHFALTMIRESRSLGPLHAIDGTVGEVSLAGHFLVQIPDVVQVALLERKLR